MLFTILVLYVLNVLKVIASFCFFKIWAYLFIIVPRISWLREAFETVNSGFSRSEEDTPVLFFLLLLLCLWWKGYF